MQPSESAFDRVKSLLGKMDRSIDEARERRLREDDPDAPEHDHIPNTDAAPDAELADASDANRAEEAAQAPRPASKYGRATPLRDLPSKNPPSWREG